MTVTVGLSIEKQVQTESIIGNFADGYDKGKEVGEEDSESDNSCDTLLSLWFRSIILCRIQSGLFSRV